MKELMNKELIKQGYSIAKFSSSAVSFGASVYYESYSLALAMLLGLSSGALSYATTLYFKGSEIDDYFSDDEQDGSLLLIPCHENYRGFSTSAQTWMYTVGSCLQELAEKYFLLQALLAWYQALRSLQPVTLQPLPNHLLILVLFYTVVFNLPFLLSSELQETCRKLDPIGHDAGRLPPQQLLMPIINVFEGYLGLLVVNLGAVAHCFESLLSMMLIIPPNVLIALCEMGQFYFVLGVSGLAVIAALFLLVHLVQTLFFEGCYSIKNLKSGHELETMTISHWLIAYGVLYSSKLLWTQSVLHAIEDALPVVTLLTSLGFSSIGYMVGAVVISFSYLGTQCSEVHRAGVETQRALDEYEKEHPDWFGSISVGVS